MENCRLAFLRGGGGVDGRGRRTHIVACLSRQNTRGSRGEGRGGGGRKQVENEAYTW